ncbi:MAG: hypothetical protein K2R98_33645 [Gemmataceae bacterium]|nr:hypothetical protein [Gemmataceae bacterium]
MPSCTSYNSALVDRLRQVVAEGALTVTEHSQPVPDGQRLREVISSALEQQLAQLACNALLCE